MSISLGGDGSAQTTSTWVNEFTSTGPAPRPVDVLEEARGLGSTLAPLIEAARRSLVPWGSRVRISTPWKKGVDQSIHFLGGSPRESLSDFKTHAHPSPDPNKSKTNQLNLIRTVQPKTLPMTRRQARVVPSPTQKPRSSGRFLKDSPSCSRIRRPFVHARSCSATPKRSAPRSGDTPDPKWGGTRPEEPSWPRSCAPRAGTGTE